MRASLSFGRGAASLGRSRSIIFGGGGVPLVLLASGALSPRAVLTRAQTTGVSATGETPHTTQPLLTSAVLAATATFTRAQTTGVEATGETTP
jgi:hypothetical protein